MSLPIIFISGPTAIGKSDLALRLAKKINGEVINADSMQVYSKLNILTSRPSEQDHIILPHHLYGHVDPAHRYNVSEWCEDAIKIIKINNKKRIYSILVGGTGLYIDKLLNGLADLPRISESYKKKSTKLFIELGLEEFYKTVYKIDKFACEKISKNDTQRLKRIWEVYNATGKKLSDWINGKHQFFLKNFKYKIFLFTPNRKHLYEKINNRFITMIDNGAIQEVQKLLSMNLDATLPIMKAHGVPEISKYLSGSIDLQECISKGQQVTRNYAKRQLTWWKSSKLNINTIFNEFPSNTDLKSLNI